MICAVSKFAVPSEFNKFKSLFKYTSGLHLTVVSGANLYVQLSTNSPKIIIQSQFLLKSIYLCFRCRFSYKHTNNTKQYS